MPITPIACPQSGNPAVNSSKAIRELSPQCMLQHRFYRLLRRCAYGVSWLYK
jgi:hypothetical protein